MRIAQVAPLAEAVPPRLYGGTERVVSSLTEELVKLGHQVTLFASGDSMTSAQLVPCAHEGLRLAGIREHVAHHLAMLEEVRSRAHEFDVIHFHVDLLQHAFFRDMAHKCVTTLHGRLDLPDSMPVFRTFPEMPLVSISDSQRAPMPPNANWLATVHHGLPPTVCPFGVGGGEYLAFLGRISPEKRPDRAIEMAKLAGVPLKIAAKVDIADRGYFEEVVEPLLDHPLIEFIGEIDERTKWDFLGRALALLFPIDWPEPFGIVMIEAMSAGTPVIAWDAGSVPEVVEDGVSGVIVRFLEDAPMAVARARRLRRTDVRRSFASRFTAARMAAGYLAAYRQLLEGSEMPESAAVAASVAGILPLGEKRARIWPQPAGAQPGL
jgi:glycosyltransferase involved in cell wall biosynthesis